MTYAAEPYAQFVDDLLTALTGGEVREQFRFLPELAPFRLAAAAPILPATVRVHGLVDGQYTRFRAGTDYRKPGADKTLQWLDAAGAARWKGACSGRKRNCSRTSPPVRAVSRSSTNWA